MANEMTTTKAFKFGHQMIHVVEIEGDPWFFALDICHALGMPVGGANGSTARYLGCLSEDQRRTIKVDLIDGIRGNPKRTLISETGLYKIVLRSDKSQAKPFQDWVTREVLPAIRKDGMYVAGEEKVRTGEMEPEELARRMTEAWEKKITRLTAERDEFHAALKAALAENDKLTAQVKEAKAEAKANSAFMVNVADREFTMDRIVATLLGANKNALKGDLGRLGYLHRSKPSAPWRVYSQYRGTLFTEYLRPDGKFDIAATKEGFRIINLHYEKGEITRRANWR